MSLTKLKTALVLVLATVVLGGILLGRHTAAAPQGQAEKPRAEGTKKSIAQPRKDDETKTRDAKTAAKIARLMQALALQIDTKDFQAPMTLKETLVLIRDKVNATNKERDALPILIDTEAFKAEMPDAPAIYDTPVKFALDSPRKLSVYSMIRMALIRIPLGEPTRVVRDGVIEVVARGEPTVTVRDGGVVITTKLAANKLKSTKGP